MVSHDSKLTLFFSHQSLSLVKVRVRKNFVSIFCNMYFFQPPKLPLPNIEMTLKRYLNAVESFTGPDQFAATSILVQEFLDDQQKIKAIMDLLRQKTENEESWVSLHICK